MGEPHLDTSRPPIYTVYSTSAASAIEGIRILGHEMHNCDGSAETGHPLTKELPHDLHLLLVRQVVTTYGLGGQRTRQKAPLP